HFRNSWSSRINFTLVDKYSSSTYTNCCNLFCSDDDFSCKDSLQKKGIQKCSYQCNNIFDVSFYCLWKIIFRLGGAELKCKQHYIVRRRLSDYVTIHSVKNFLSADN